tara:strand:- start:116 stop:568 length:453 start_codon:yes stop_codon:yes gene_type:complete
MSKTNRVYDDDDYIESKETTKRLLILEKSKEAFTMGITYIMLFFCTFLILNIYVIYKPSTYLLQQEVKDSLDLKFKNTTELAKEFAMHKIFVDDFEAIRDSLMVTTDSLSTKSASLITTLDNVHELYGQKFNQIEQYYSNELQQCKNGKN